MTGRTHATASVAVAALLCFSLPVSAAKPESSARARAEAEVAEGAKMFDQGRFREALSKYESAFSIFPSPRIHYNLAFAYQRLGKNAQAFTAFERFLRESPDSGPKYLAEARAELGRLSRKVAFVAVTCDTDGVIVTLDGAAIGSTPLPGRFPVDPGRHELVMRADKLEARSRSFTATAGHALELRVDMRMEATEARAGGERASRHAALTMSGPAKAEALIREATELRKASKDARAYPLFLEAYEAQPAPRTAAQLGLVEIQLGYWIAAEGHLRESLAFPRDPWIAANRDSLETALANARAAIGDLVISGTPAGAAVLLNGNVEGNLPVVVTRAGEGPAKLEVRASGYAPAFRSLNVRGNQRQEVSVILEKLTGPAGSMAASAPDQNGPDAQVATREGGPATGSRGAAWARPLAWSGAGVSAAALGVAVYETVLWRRKYTQFDGFRAPPTPGERTTCGVNAPKRGAPGCDGIYRELDKARKIAIAGYVAGGLLAVGATTVLLLTRGKGASSNLELACAPSLTTRGGFCEFRF